MYGVIEDGCDAIDEIRFYLPLDVTLKLLVAQD